MDFNCFKQIMGSLLIIQGKPTVSPDVYVFDQGILTTRVLCRYKLSAGMTPSCNRKKKRDLKMTDLTS